MLRKKIIALIVLAAFVFFGLSPNYLSAFSKNVGRDALRPPGRGADSWQGKEFSQDNPEEILRIKEAISHAERKEEEKIGIGKALAELFGENKPEELKNLLEILVSEKNELDKLKKTEADPVKIREKLDAMKEHLLTVTIKHAVLIKQETSAKIGENLFQQLLADLIKIAYNGKAGKEKLSENEIGKRLANDLKEYLEAVRAERDKQQPVGKRSETKSSLPKRKIIFEEFVTDKNKLPPEIADSFNEAFKAMYNFSPLQISKQESKYTNIMGQKIDNFVGIVGDRFVNLNKELVKLDDEKKRAVVPLLEKYLLYSENILNQREDLKIKHEQKMLRDILRDNVYKLFATHFGTLSREGLPKPLHRAAADALKRARLPNIPGGAAVPVAGLSSAVLLVAALLLVIVGGSKVVVREDKERQNLGTWFINNIKVSWGFDLVTFGLVIYFFNDFLNNRIISLVVVAYIFIADYWFKELRDYKLDDLRHFLKLNFKAKLIQLKNVRQAV